MWGVFLIRKLIYVRSWWRFQSHSCGCWHWNRYQTEATTISIPTISGFFTGIFWFIDRSWTNILATNVFFKFLAWPRPQTTALASCSANLRFLWVTILACAQTILSAFPQTDQSNSAYVPCPSIHNPKIPFSGHWGFFSRPRAIFSTSFVVPIHY